MKKFSVLKAIGIILIVTALSLCISTLLVHLLVNGILIGIFGFAFSWSWLKSFGVAAVIVVVRALLGANK